MSHMSQTHNVPGLWTYKLLRLPFITCCIARVVSISENHRKVADLFSENSKDLLRTDKTQGDGWVN